MKASILWCDKPSDEEAEDQIINSLCFNPDGSQLLVACGQKVLVYDTIDGALKSSLSGHAGAVHSISYSADGTRFASGGADKLVVIWTHECQGLLKYAHDYPVQCVAYHPSSHLLASCSSSDFGLWSPEQKNVIKTKLTGRITCCAWSADGQLLAFGLYNGQLIVRDKTGKERRLGYDPCALSWFVKDALKHESRAEFLLVGGANRECTIYSREGFKLGTVAVQDSWIWCCCAKPDGSAVAIGTYNGIVGLYDIKFGVVHGIHKDRYAYRDNMTDVIVHHLTTDQKVKVKCRELVRKIAVYKTILAIQTLDKILLYEAPGDVQHDMKYKATQKINKNIECSSMLVTSSQIITCQDKRLQCFNFTGEEIRVWQMDSPIRYMKLVGGPPQHEAILLGLKNGGVYQVFVNNAFPQLLAKQSSTIFCIDMNVNRTKIAVIDDTNTLYVYDVWTKELLYQEPNAHTVAWNGYFADMLAFSGEGQISIKVADFPVYKQHLQLPVRDAELLGLIVGFNGCTIYLLHLYAMSGVTVPVTDAVYRYINKKQLDNAYRLACLGESSQTWEALGHAAIEQNDYVIAKKCFSRVRDMKYCNLLSTYEEVAKRGETKPNINLGDYYAYAGRFQEAARNYQHGGAPDRAMTMFSDLRMFDQAKEYMVAGDVDQQKLLNKQAEWAMTMNEQRTAAELYLAAHDYLRAIDLAGKNKWSDLLASITSKLDKAQHDLLKRCARYFVEMKQYTYAADVYEKMGDIKSLLDMRIILNQWDEVFSLAKRYPLYHSDAYYNYGQYLAENDRFVDAQRAFYKAGRIIEARNVLQALTDNAVNETRFKDAGYYNWLLSKEYLLALSETPNDDLREQLFKKYNQCLILSELYYAYQNLYEYTTEPFVDTPSQILFNIARFIYHKLTNLKEIPPGISKFRTCYTACKIANKLNANKFSRQMIELMKDLTFTHNLGQKRTEIEQLALELRAKTFSDDSELLPLCYRCSHHSELLNPHGNECSNCGSPFVLSFLSFDVLPLVEFVLPHDINDEDAYNLLEQIPNSQLEAKPGGQTLNASTANRLIINEQFQREEKDPFLKKMTKYSANPNEYRPVVVDRSLLKAMDPSLVFVCKWPFPLRWKWYRIIVPETQIGRCRHCNKFFHNDEFELAILETGGCPFCRNKKEGDLTVGLRTKSNRLVNNPLKPNAYLLRQAVLSIFY
ncbi:unnamed protein product [Didymodactylos carnosus]|uniref:Intraflagellar transport protein 122 homolog n=1 Tax=Didymodactylos carnosus TaxID=1234261 RepID=A0A814RPK9_9BILA|nr:unnamed protein product [Didymodactylos carnosus]CAF1135468.1 unnamed protein product [Didymodactylos carnosus]CAF3703008.1 unnamed protein product [Didymodactylos carnosus]CAF3899195.1 unnamed protein product [Didymodactylos carnosus]